MLNKHLIKWDNKINETGDKDMKIRWNKIFFISLFLKINSMLTDIHCHKVNSEDIRTIYNIAINDDAVTLPHGPNIFFSAGIHPWDAGNIRSAWIENMEILLNFEQLIAVGECGLDKNSPASIEKQIEVFELQINLSESNKKPLIVHCVGCYNELMSLYKAFSPKQPWIIHGFRAKPEMAVQLTRAGMYISYGEKFNPQSVQATPVKKILVESDDCEVPLQELYLAVATVKGCEVRELVAVNDIFGFE
ncbi:MAG: TatD family hydrolase [Paludibacter sp.]|nr:TatD family hydrolase [Paludibacter sp.]MDD4427931.1 TatD family hydrolase [Paludibacter sp.]